MSSAMRRQSTSELYEEYRRLNLAPRPRCPPESSIIFSIIMSELGVSFIRRRSFLRALAGSALYGFQSRMRAESGVKITSVETLALDDPGKYSFTIVRVRTRRRH